MNKQQYVLAGLVLAVLIVGSWVVLKNVPGFSQQLSLDQAGEETMSASLTATVKHYASPPPLTIDTQVSYRASIQTSLGTMNVKLFASENPVTVNNFVFLANEHYYDKTPFHRILSGFMIQGGDPTGTGMGNPGYRFDDEPVTRNYTRGTIAMANSGPDTNGSQFFIMHKDYPLPKQYVIFGAIDEGDAASLKILDAIAATPVADNGNGEVSAPTQPVFVETITIATE